MAEFYTAAGTRDLLSSITGRYDSAIHDLMQSTISTDGAITALGLRVTSLENSQTAVRVIGPSDPVPSLPPGTLVVRRGD